MPDRLTTRLAVIAAVLLLVSAGPAVAAPTVAIAGDSIAHRARGAVRNAIQPEHRIVWYETQKSATIARIGPELLAEVRRPNGPRIVLVELGVGNAFWGTRPGDFRRQVRRLVRDLLREVPCVRWFEQKPGGNLAYPGINERAVLFNRIVREEVDVFARARTVHYATWTRMAGNSVFVADRLHHNAAGKRGLARLARQAVEGCDPAVTSGPFWDVPDRHWAAEAIAWVADQGLIDGYPNDTFRADVGGIRPPLSRVDWVRALWRRAHRPAHPASPWPDATGTAAAPLAWAWAEELTSVPADRPFRAPYAVSRGDAVAWLYRAAGRPEVAGYPAHGLTDVPAGLARAVRWAKGIGVITAPDGGRFSPRRALTRAEAAAYLYRAEHPSSPPGPPAGASDGPALPTAPTTTTAPGSTPPPTAPATTVPATTVPAVPTTTAAPADPPPGRGPEP